MDSSTTTSNEAIEEKVTNEQQKSHEHVNDKDIDIDNGIVHDYDPLKMRDDDYKNNNIVQDGDYVILQFGDGRLLFAQANSASNKNYRDKRIENSVKINRRSYMTYPLIGLPYGTVLEQSSTQLIPLSSGSTLIPAIPKDLLVDDNDDNDDNNNDDEMNDGMCNENDNDDVEGVEEDNKDDKKDSKKNQVNNNKKRDNRHLIDNNTAQTLNSISLQKLKNLGTMTGSDLVQTIIQNSSTFANKTKFSQLKYVKKKQQKYQPRCRVIRTNSLMICQLLHSKDSKRIMNVRHDTLGQILSYSNITSGQQVLVFETCQGLITGAIAERLGGYGSIISIYTGQQHSYEDMISKFNLKWYEQYIIKWLHSSHILRPIHINRNNELINTRELPIIPIHNDDIQLDEEERLDRSITKWPCPLQNHTKNYLLTDPILSQSIYKIQQFLKRRSIRFARKITRETSVEVYNHYIKVRQCHSLIIVIKPQYNIKETLLQLLPYLAPSCPFVIYCEYIEPLNECFRILQGDDIPINTSSITTTDDDDTMNPDNKKRSKQQQRQEDEQQQKQQQCNNNNNNKPLAINLRLSDTWTREYQILPGRTHPNMNMSQSGGFILTGIKLDPIDGHNELDSQTLIDIKKKLGPRRHRYGTAGSNATRSKNNNNNNNSSKNGMAEEITEPNTKRSRQET